MMHWRQGSDKYMHEWKSKYACMKVLCRELVQVQKVCNSSKVCDAYLMTTCTCMYIDGCVSLCRQEFLLDWPKAKKNLSAHIHGLCKFLNTQTSVDLKLIDKSQVDTRGRHSSLVKQVFGIQSIWIAWIAGSREKLQNIQKSNASSPWNILKKKLYRYYYIHTALQ